MSEGTKNKVALMLKKKYCLAGAKFCSRELEMGWKEIENLEAERDALQAKLETFKSMLDVAWDGLQEADCEGFSFELKKFMEGLE